MGETHTSVTSGVWLVEIAHNQRIPGLIVQAVVTPKAANLSVRILNPTDYAAVLHKSKTITTMEALQDTEISAAEEQPEPERGLSREKKESSCGG